MQPLRIAISPCPNDTFIFDALVHGRIDTEGLRTELHFADVEALNRSAFRQEFEVTKLSYHAYAYASEHYILSDSGSALGNKCGPLLIAHSPLDEAQLRNARIALPGQYTTANLLFSLKYPDARDKTFLLFSEIEDRVLDGSFDAGVIIHENRFTYEQKGLQKICDLGEYWENTYHAPIPLGGIAIRRDTAIDRQRLIQRLIRQSIEYAFAHPEASAAFVKQHSQEMADEVIRQHIGLYVNAFSLGLGETGHRAVETLYRVGREKQQLPELHQPIFVP